MNGNDFVFFLFMIVVGTVAYAIYYTQFRWKKPGRRFSISWRSILDEKIEFYKRLNPKGKALFEYKVEEFLLNCKIVSVDTTVNDTDRMLIASSAIIPIFAYPDWKYQILDEIVLYPDNFDEHFRTTGPNRFIRGLVGYGYLQGKLLISRTALYEGFEDFADKRNTCLHEFIHIIDMSDGKIDGIPEKLLARKYAIPWMFLMSREFTRIKAGVSDLHPYAAKNAGEFLAVTSEYFFERPDDFKREHPELFNALKIMFRQPLPKAKN